jgi:hypothetical protein
MNSIFSFEETFTGGFPVKSSDATANTLDGKAFRVGYQAAKLETDRQKLMQDQMLFEEQKAKVIQELLSAQAQAATAAGAQLGAQQVLAQGGGMGMPPGMGGGMPPGMPMPPRPEAMMGGMPPMVGAPAGPGPMEMAMGSAPQIPMM